LNLWKHIRKDWDVFYCFVGVEVGDGSRTRFWHDVWCGDRSLKDTFPGLLCYARNRDALYSFRMGRGGDDKLCWTPSKRRSFEVKSLYKVLLPNVDSSFLWKSIWRTKEPFTIAFFSWTASLGKILTLNNLHKCYIIVRDWYCMCKKSGEILAHLFYCDVAITFFIVMS